MKASVLWLPGEKNLAYGKYTASNQAGACPVCLRNSNEASGCSGKNKWVRTGCKVREVVWPQITTYSRPLERHWLLLWESKHLKIWGVPWPDFHYSVILKCGDSIGGRREVRTPVKRLVWNLRQEMMVAWTWWVEQAVKVLRVVWFWIYFEGGATGIYWDRV